MYMKLKELKLKASLVAQMVRNPPTMQETWVWSLGREEDIPLEEDMATHFSILAWRIPVDRGAWWATIPGITKSRTWLSDSNTHIYCDKVEKAGFFSLLKKMSRSWDLLKFTSRIGTFWRIQINLIPLSMYSVTRLQLWLSAFGRSMVFCYLSLKRSIFTW